MTGTIIDPTWRVRLLDALSVAAETEHPWREWIPVRAIIIAPARDAWISENSFDDWDDGTPMLTDEGQEAKDGMEREWVEWGETALREAIFLGHVELTDRTSEVCADYAGWAGGAKGEDALREFLRQFSPVRIVFMRRRVGPRIGFDGLGER